MDIKFRNLRTKPFIDGEPVEITVMVNGVGMDVELSAERTETLKQEALQLAVAELFERDIIRPSGQALAIAS